MQSSRKQKALQNHWIHMNSSTHITVFLKQAVESLNVKKDSWYIDATFGQGGHTQEILNHGAHVLAFDFDEQAITSGLQNFATQIASKQLILVRDNFTQCREHVEQLKKAGVIDQISGVLFDFGTSTQQLTSQERGFSFEGDGPLDMRMDTRLGVQAKDLLAVLPEKQLSDLFLEYGGEHDAKKIARAIKNSHQPITTNKQLSELIFLAKGRKRDKIHPATKVFQALRIAVNMELENIQEALPKALEIVAAQGKIVTIAFHEGEDRIVKTTFKSWEEQQLGYMETKKPIEPTQEELAQNPRSRSAKMRVFVRNK